MTKTIQLALISLPFIAILDFIWLGLVAQNFYRSELGSLYAPHVVWGAAILFYIIYLLGLSYFVIAPAVRAHNLKFGIATAAFFALVAYGTYDLTSLSITTNWPLALSVVDMTWGVVEGVLTTIGAYLIATKVFKW